MPGKQSLTKATAKTQGTQSPQLQFNAKCKEIKKQQQRVERLRRQRQQVFARFCKDVLPLENQHTHIVYRKTKQLINFLTKKSMTNYQRDELHTWIQEEVEFLLEHPFKDSAVDVDALATAYGSSAEKVLPPPSVQQIHEYREFLEDEWGITSNLSDNELAEMMLNPQKMANFIREWHANAEENAADFTQNDSEFEGFDDFFDTEHESESQSCEDKQKVDALFSHSVINRMYKRLAAAFHPDRTQDAEEKQHRHQLMTTLSDARKSHDVWAIFNLYQEHIDTEANLPEEDLPALNLLLNQKIAHLKAEYDDLDNDTLSEEGIVWDKLKGSTQKIIDKKFDKHIAALRSFIILEEHELGNIGTLKALKTQLSMRYQESCEEKQEFFDAFFSEFNNIK